MAFCEYILIIHVHIDLSSSSAAGVKNSSNIYAANDGPSLASEANLQVCESFFVRDSYTNAIVGIPGYICMPSQRQRDRILLLRGTYDFDIVR